MWALGVIWTTPFVSALAVFHAQPFLLPTFFTSGFGRLCIGRVLRHLRSQLAESFCASFSQLEAYAWLDVN